MMVQGNPGIRDTTQLIWVSKYPMIFVRVSSVFGGWPWIMTWSSWDCAMGCDAKSSGPRGMEKANKNPICRVLGPSIFLATQTFGYKKLAFFGTFHTKKAIYAPEKNSEDVMLSNLIFWNMFQFVDIDARNSQQLFFFWGGHPERRRSCSWFVGSQFLGSILERYCFSWAVSCCTPCNIIDFLAVFCRIFWKHHN